MFANQLDQNLIITESLLKALSMLPEIRHNMKEIPFPYIGVWKVYPLKMMGWEAFLLGPQMAPSCTITNTNEYECLHICVPVCVTPNVNILAFLGVPMGICNFPPYEGHLILWITYGLDWNGPPLSEPRKAIQKMSIVWGSFEQCKVIW